MVHRGAGGESLIDRPTFEMAVEFDKVKKTRTTYRRNITKLVTKISDLLAAGSEQCDKGKLRYHQNDLCDKLNELKAADKVILDNLIANAEQDVVDKEMDEIDEYKEKVSTTLFKIEEVIGKLPNGESTPIQGGSSSEIGQSGSTESLQSEASPNVSTVGGAKVNVKLPKLEIRKFTGKIHEFQEFWDSFTSAIHENEALSKVDKFKYLKSYLEDQARSAISGISLTDKNYDTAVELLQKRFGKPEVIQLSHINQLLNLMPVFNEKHVQRLRALQDQIKTHFRGLQAQGVDAKTYSSIVVPILMEKIPEQVRFNMIRSSDKNHLKWTLEDLTVAFDEELEIRESHTPSLKAGGAVQTSEKVTSGARYQGGTATALFIDAKKKCVFCLKDHLPELCDQITDIDERKGILKKYARCFACLNSNHRAFECRSKGVCRSCKGKHHTSICHNNQRNLKPAAGDSVHKSNTPLNASAPSWVGNTGSGTSVALQTALAKVKGEKCGSRVRVLFDTGSHTSFISAEAVDRIGLRPVRREALSIQAFGSTEVKERVRDVVEVSLVSLYERKSVNIHCFVVDEIASITNVHPEKVKKSYPHIKDVFFSDVCRNEDVLDINVLIGSDNFWRFQKHEVKRGGPNDPVAVKTVLGWVLSGPLQGKSLNSTSFVNVNYLPSFSLKSSETQRIDEEINKLWDLDSIGIRTDNEIHENVLDNIVFTGERYSVGLPWKVGHKSLPTNYNISLMRLKGLGKKLRNEPMILDKYNDILQEQVASGVIEQVSQLEPAEKTHYLPHMAVVREESETTKVRIVYNASCKEKKSGTSLNDCLHVGPALTPLMFDILLRFRENRIALIGDIEKAFLNIEICPTDRDCLRFLWFEDCMKEDSEIIVYRFNRVVFGVNSSPFLLNAVLRHHVESYKEVDPNFVSKMLNSFYVDDLVSGSDSIEDAFKLYKQAKSRMLEGGFRLRKWKTNSIELANAIKECESETESEKPNLKPMVLQDESTYTKETLGQGNVMGKACKVLGMKWDSEIDTWEFDLGRLKQSANVERPTKRGILSTLATLFDPLGVVSPILVTAKVLLQELCLQKIGWDDPIPQDKIGEWISWLDDLKRVQSITLPRCLYDKSEEEIFNCQLHGFGDASSKAYCAVVYLVYQTDKGVEARLLCAKTRVAPLKELTIPRLELLSARILAVLMDTVYKALQQQIEIECMKYWLDSKTALHWIYNNGQWKQWVQFRVSEILKISKAENWGHVAGRDNPADIGSRGALASQLRSSALWWEGPLWLKGGKEDWPKGLILEDTEDVQIERKKANVMITITEEKKGVSQIVDIKKFSTLKRLINVTAWIRRFIENVKAKREKRELNLEGLSVEELCYAERLWIKDAQETLKGDSSFKKTRMQLGIIETEGIMVCRGRLERSDLELESKYPIYLPKEHRFVELLVLDCHSRVFHCGLKSTLAELRARFWISKGRQFVKKILKRCFICRKMEGRPFQPPPTSAIPDFRVTEAAPFSNVGIDFAGPLYVKENKGNPSKAYVCLFVCCVTRGLHLELVQNLTASSFLNCFRRFCARRGTPKIINSDNAKTFQSSANLLRKFHANDRVKEFSESMRVSWKFNLQLSPWQGGHYERMVRSIKRCLRKVLGNSLISFDELATIVTEVECILNSRPLSYMYDELGGEVLTPSHLFVGRRLLSLPSGNDIHPKSLEHDGEYTLNKRFLHLTRILSHFWNRWRTEYIMDLRETHKLNNNKSPKVETGDVVLVQEEHAKRASWKIGIVDELIIGKDGEIRGAKVRKAGKGKHEFIKRPVQKLIPLEIASRVDLRAENSEEGQTGSKDVSQKEDREDKQEIVERRKRYGRAAAQTSRAKTRLMLDP